MQGRAWAAQGPSAKNCLEKGSSAIIAHLWCPVTKSSLLIVETSQDSLSFAVTVFYLVTGHTIAIGVWAQFIAGYGMCNTDIAMLHNHHHAFFSMISSDVYSRASSCKTTETKHQSCLVFIICFIVLSLFMSKLLYLGVLSCCCAAGGTLGGLVVDGHVARIDHSAAALIHSNRL